MLFKKPLNITFLKATRAEQILEFPDNVVKHKWPIEADVNNELTFSDFSVVVSYPVKEAECPDGNPLAIDAETDLLSLPVWL